MTSVMLPVSPEQDDSESEPPPSPSLEAGNGDRVLGKGLSCWSISLDMPLSDTALLVTEGPSSSNMSSRGSSKGVSSSLPCRKLLRKSSDGSGQS